MDDKRILSCSELSEGGYVEARVRGTVHFHGRVHEIMPSMNIFWAIDSMGERRIIDFGEYEIHGRHLG